jgi:hypothetical protein
MGFRDDIRRLKDIQRANPHLSTREIQDELELQKQKESDVEYARFFAAGEVEPYVETLAPKTWKRTGLDALVKNYIRIVGLQPEDVFGMYGDQDGERSSLRIVYRDRPEYRDGRRRFRMIADDQASSDSRRL